MNTSKPLDYSPRLGRSISRELRAIAPVCAALLPAAAGLAQGTMYACESSREFYTMNLATGAKTLLGNISASPTITASLTYDCGTQTTYLSSTFANAGVSKKLYTLNLTTRQATLVGNYGDPAIIMHAIEIDAKTGNLYGVSIHNHGLYGIDKATGAATLIGLTGLPIGATTFNALGYNPDDDTMYLINTGTDSLYTVDLATGLATLVGPLNGPIGCGAMAYNHDTKAMYMVDNDADVLYTVNTTTGAATAIGPTGAGNLIGLVYVSPNCPVVTPPCYPDCDASGELGIDDFICFQTLFAIGDPSADCDESGGLSIDDFICFQTLFAVGC